MGFVGSNLIQSRWFMGNRVWNKLWGTVNEPFWTVRQLSEPFLVTQGMTIALPGHGCLALK